MKACCYCKYGFEDDEGTWCGVDWDTVEYLPIEKQEAIKTACREAKRKEQKEAVE